MAKESKSPKKPRKEGKRAEPAPSAKAAQKREPATSGSDGAWSTTGKITAIALAFVGFIIVKGVYTGIQESPGESLDLLDLSKEQVEIPEAFRERGIPWEEIHEKMDGANLDKPRAYVAFYGQGRMHGGAWGEGAGLKGAVKSAYDAAVSENTGPVRADVAVLVIPTDRDGLRLDNYKGNFSNVHRGVRGAFIEPKEAGGTPFRLSPTETVATNIPIVDALENEAKARSIELDAWLEGSNIFSFDAEQYFVPLGSKEPAQKMLRGNRLIPTSEVTQKSVQRFTDLLEQWMFSNLHPGGRMTYTYFPSTGRESNNNNNMIRQWMATVSMGRIAVLYPERNLAARAKENIEYNLGQFYKTEGDIGYIDERGTAKLGATALALLSIIESPAREEFATYEKGLMALTLNQWQPSGEFHCFFLPKDRSRDNLHNFYPGETLLSWATLYEQTKDPELLDKSMKSYRYYKDWHLRNRNPAFVPWHTQAYYILWKETKDEGLKNWIFEMNDWLVDNMQSQSRVAYDDTLGRFYAPHRNFGVPHASATGVYIEGLIDAFRLAREVGDKAHEEKYRKSILLGLRSSMQLQFQDEVDMFYARDKARLQGGMRTTVYDNEIRVDNVQHVLMGVQKVLREFRPEDYKL